MLDEWPAWRVVLKQVATLREIESWWCLSDLIRANRALDLEDEVERLVNEKQKQAQRG